MLKIEHDALNIKIDALKTKLGALQVELRALDTKIDTKVEAMSFQMTEQLSIVPTPPAIGPVRAKAKRRLDNGTGQRNDDRPKAEIDVHSTQQDSWTRLAIVNDEISVEHARRGLLDEVTVGIGRCDFLVMDARTLDWLALLKN